MDITKILFIMLGLFCTCIGAYICIKEVLKKIKCKSVTKGTVVEIEKRIKKNSKNDTKFYLYPVFEYNVLGNKYVKKSNVGSNSFKYTVGQEVFVYYNDKKPDEFYVKGYKDALQGGLIILILGLILMFLV